MSREIASVAMLASALLLCGCERETLSRQELLANTAPLPISFYVATVPKTKPAYFVCRPEDRTDLPFDYAFQSCLNWAVESGGGLVVLDGGDHVLRHTLELRSPARGIAIEGHGTKIFFERPEERGK